MSMRNVAISVTVPFVSYLAIALLVRLVFEGDRAMTPGSPPAGDNDPYQWAFLNIMGTIAQLEVDMIREWIDVSG